MAINNNRWNRWRYNLYAPFYDAIERLFASARQKSVQQLHLPPGAKVLIPGAGTGLDLPWLPPNWQLTAVDLSPGMLAQCQKRAGKLDLKLQSQVMDCHHLEFADQSFDGVLLHLILAVIPDPEALLSEVARVLKPGGQVMVLDKFLEPGQSPSPLRRLANLVTNSLFSDINRSLEPLVQVAGLTLVSKEKGLLGGAFSISRLVKP